MKQFIVLLILFPLLLAPLLYFIPKHFKKSLYPLSLTFALINFIPLFFLLIALQSSEIIIYEVGGWFFAKGIVLAIDHLSLLMLVLIQGVYFLSLIFSHSYIKEEHFRYFLLLTLGLAGLNGMVLTTDLFNMYVFLELVSIVSYALVAYNRDRYGLEAGFKYIVLGSLGSFFILWAIGLVYAVVGNLNLAYLVGVREEIPLLIRQASLVMFFVGLGLKFAIFPLHTWKADAYGTAPAPVSAFLSGVGSKVPIYILLRLFSLLFSWSFLIEQNMPYLITTIGVITILVGHLMAYRQTHLKRLLAYSSIAHIGYIVIGLGTTQLAGLEGALFHIINHGILKAGLFFLTGVIIYYYNSERISDLKGLHSKAPFLSISFIILAMGMIGLPPLNGFLSKWLIVMATIEAGYYLPGIAVALAGLLALFYYIRIIIIMFTPSDKEIIKNKDYKLLFPVYSLVTLSLLIFIFANNVLVFINRGARVLVETYPFVQAILGGG